MSMNMRFNREGMIVFADVVGSGVARAAAATKSGNPNHDTRSGKFGGGGGPAKKTNAPANVDPAEYARYLDAVREAARKFPGQLTPENLQSFIKSRAANPAAVNIQQFAQLVQQQQLNDVIDALDTNHGGFKSEAPQGYVKKVLAGLSDDDVSEIVQRLKARGIKDPHIKFGRALPGERKEAVKNIDAQKVQATDAWDWDEPNEAPAGMSYEDLIAMLKAALSDQPAPVVHVAPPVVNVAPPEVIVNVPPAPPAPRMRKVVERDDMGLILSVSEVEE